MRNDSDLARDEMVDWLVKPSQGGDGAEVPKPESLRAHPPEDLASSKSNGALPGRLDIQSSSIPKSIARVLEMRGVAHVREISDILLPFNPRATVQRVATELSRGSYERALERGPGFWKLASLGATFPGPTQAPALPGPLTAIEPLSPLNDAFRGMERDEVMADLWCSGMFTGQIALKLHVTPKVVSENLLGVALRARSDVEVYDEMKDLLRWSKFCVADSKYLPVMIAKGSGTRPSSKAKAHKGSLPVLITRAGNEDMVFYRVVKSERSYQESYRYFLELGQIYKPGFMGFDDNDIPPRAARDAIPGLTTGPCNTHYEDTVVDPVVAACLRSPLPPDYDTRMRAGTLLEQMNEVRTVAAVDKVAKEYIEFLASSRAFQELWAKRSLIRLFRKSMAIKDRARYMQRHSDDPIPLDTNQAESGNSLWSDRVYLSGAFGEEHAQAYVNLLIGHRRFTPYTRSSRGKAFNKCPIEFALRPGATLEKGVHWNHYVVKR